MAAASGDDSRPDAPLGPSTLREVIADTAAASALMQSSTSGRAARARPEGASPAHLVLTDSGRTRFSKRFATEGATRMFYPHATRRPAIDAPKGGCAAVAFCGNCDAC